MGITHDAQVAMGHAMRNLHAGVDKLASRKLAGDRGPTLTVSSRSFVPNGPLPGWCSADGGATPPALTWSPPPVKTESLVVICEDPDAPFPEPFVHWMVYGMAPTVTSLTGGTASSWNVGLNSRLKAEYAGVAPPAGHGLHRYHFQVFALDIALDLPTGTGRSALLAAMKNHVLAYGDCVGTYERG